MTKQNNPYEMHVFICTNKKEGKACCADQKGIEFHAQLKEKVKADPRFSNHKVRINKSGCLDFCNFGVAAAVFPENTIYKNLKIENLNDFVNELSLKLK